MVQIYIVNLWEHESNCCLCGKYLLGCKTGIPMLDGMPVSPEWDGEWAGMDACQQCFEMYNSGKLKMWRNGDRI